MRTRNLQHRFHDRSPSSAGGLHLRRDASNIAAHRFYLILLRRQRKKRFAFCLIVVGSVRPTVHQPLVLDAFQRDIATHLIVDSKLDAMRVAEIVFAQIPV